MPGSLARVGLNSFWSLAGHAGALLAALVAFPVVLSRLGAEEFGLISLVWLVVGYFSIFDLGLGRTFTRLVAMYNAHHEPDAIREVLAAGGLLMAALSMLSAFFVLSACISLWFFSSFVPLGIEWSQWVGIAVLLAIAVPFVVFASGLRGVFEGYDRFAEINIIRLFGGAAMFLAPMFVCFYTRRIDLIVASIVFTRVLVFAITLEVARRLFAGQLVGCLSLRHCLEKRWKEIVTYGGWLSVSNIVGPIIVYLDRILIVSFLSAGMLAAYTIPHDFITRLVVGPAAIGVALFPALSVGVQSSLPGRALLAVAFMLLPIVGAASFYADPMLELWLGDAMPEGSGSVLQILCIGVLFNGFAQIPFVSIQSMGRADLTAKLHIVELGVFSVVATLLISQYSLMGAAIAWSLRAAFDCVALTAIYAILNAGFRRSWLAINAGLYVLPSALLCTIIYL